MKSVKYEWIINEGDKSAYRWPLRLGWWLGNIAARYRKSYGTDWFAINYKGDVLRFWPRRWLVMFLTAFIEANLKTR